MIDLWNNIKQTFDKKGGSDLLKLNDGASESELNELEKHIGLELPSSFRQFYSIHNGQSSNEGRGFFFGVRLLSLEDIRKQWDTWVSLEGDNLNEDLYDSMKSNPPGVIKRYYLNRKWIPFTHDLGGNHIGIDYDPDVKGSYQQIISFGRDEDMKKLKAGSFDEFIEKVNGYFESINWSLNSDQWDIKEKEFDIHFHDWNNF